MVGIATQLIFCGCHISLIKSSFWIYGYPCISVCTGVGADIHLYLYGYSNRRIECSIWIQYYPHKLHTTPARVVVIDLAAFITGQGKVTERPSTCPSIPVAISQTTALIGQFTSSSRHFSTMENRLDNSVRCPHKAKPLSSLRRPPKLLNRLRNDRQVSQSG